MPTTLLPRSGCAGPRGSSAAPASPQRHAPTARALSAEPNASCPAKHPPEQPYAAIAPASPPTSTATTAGAKPNGCVEAIAPAASSPADLEQILSPHHPPDMRLKRLIVELAAVPPPRKHHHLDAPTDHRRPAHPHRHPGTATQPRSLRRDAPIKGSRAPARSAGEPSHDARPRR